jgi:hypothetical protein
MRIDPIISLRENPRMGIDPELAKDLSEKSNPELIAILEKPDDWMPPVVEFARLELGRRSVAPVQIEQLIAEKATQNTEELQRRATQPLSFWEIVFSALYGGVLGLLGLVFIWLQASRFKSQGFLLKANKSWRVYWLGFGCRIAVVLLILAIALMA